MENPMLGTRQGGGTNTPDLKAEETAMPPLDKQSREAFVTLAAQTANTS